MKNNIDFKRIASRLNVSVEQIADTLGLRYSDMAAMVKGEKEIPDNIVGKLYRKYGGHIFF